jgi:hypothetical protein
MSANGWWVLVVAALAGGAGVGGWVTLLLARKRFDGQLRRATEELTQRNAKMADQLRAAQARSDAELDKARNGFKRQLAAMVDEPRVALERAEARLKAVYAELDRLRGKANADTGSAELTDGFAATRPMHDGM